MRIGPLKPLVHYKYLESKLHFLLWIYFLHEWMHPLSLLFNVQCMSVQIYKLSYCCTTPVYVVVYMIFPIFKSYSFSSNEYWWKKFPIAATTPLHFPFVFVDNYSSLWERERERFWVRMIWSNNEAVIENIYSHKLCIW